MDVHIFSDNKKIEKSFAAVSSFKGFQLTIYEVSEFKEEVKKLNHCEMVYLDIETMDGVEIKKNLNFMSKLKFVRCGIIDSLDKTDSVSHLFHMGFSDYIGKKELSDGISPQRIKDNILYKECNLPPISSLGAKITAKKAPQWDKIEEGKEYTFCFMFLRIDKIKEMKRDLGHKFTEQLTRKFTGLFEKRISGYNGRVWNWDINKGVALFPFNDNCCDIIMAGYKIMRDSLLLSSELLHSPVKLQFTIILHLGNLEYHKRGSTGTTVSESMNLIYHASELMATPGNYYLTQNISEYIPKQIEDLFVDNGNFEGYSFKRMKRMNSY